MNLTVLRNAVTVATITIDEETKFSQKLMGEHKITVFWTVPVPTPLLIGDYIEHEGERFYLNAPPELEKINNFTYLYEAIFEGEIYYLYNKLFMDEGQADFSYVGTPDDFIELLLTNINSTQSGWTKNSVDNAPQQTLTFSNDTCRTALTKIAEAFDMEYRLAGKEINLGKNQAIATTYSFAYGRDNGLYTLTRQNIDDKGILTRVFGFGARKNLSTDYRSAATRLVFEERFLENNADIYGIREGAVTFEDIYPQRTGVVSAINPQDQLEFTDNTLDFDINDQLLEGTTAKVVFKTGALTGYEFEIKRYLNTSKTFIILPFSEENGYTLPNSLNYPEVGDEYTLVDIKMPQTYIDAAETLLETKTQEYLDENSVPRVVYGVDLDEKYVRDNDIELTVGKLVNVVDAALGIDSDIRISEVSYPLVNPQKLTAIISDTIPYTVQERLIADTIDNLTLTKNTDRRRAELARTSVARLRQLQDLVFDPDDYFDPGNIKPASIETLMLSVGAKSQNFGLLDVSMQPNSGGNPANLVVSGGQLVHYELEIDGLGYVWSINGQSFTALDPVKHYFLYAKCSKSSLTGIWELSEVPRLTEEVGGQYLFNLGILYPVANDRRDFDFTNGMTFINGDTITTGKITSLDGLSYFDLTQGKFKVGDNNYSFDWNVTAPGRLTIKGALLQTTAGEDVNLVNYRGAYSAPAFYVVNDAVTYQGSTYRCISAIGGVAPPNATYWQLYVAGGVDGADGADGADGVDGADGTDGNDGPGIVYRGTHSSTTAYYNNALRRDVVLRLGVYYIYKGPDGAINSFTASQWDNFGAQFTSVATDTLLAENANIGEWIIKSGKISSQEEFGGNPKAVLDGVVGKLSLQTGIKRYNATGGATSNIPSSLVVQPGFIQMEVDAGASQPASEVTIRPDQIAITGAFSGSGGGGDVYVGGPMAAIKAVITANKGNIISTDLLAAVYGKATNTGAAAAYGGYFVGLKMEGPIVEQTRRISSSFTISNTSTDYHLIHTGTNDITITMPSSPEIGRTFIIKRSNSGDVFINGNGVSLYRHVVQGTEFIPVVGMAFRLTYDGTYWQYYQMWG